MSGGVTIDDYGPTLTKLGFRQLQPTIPIWQQKLRGVTVRIYLWDQRWKMRGSDSIRLRSNTLKTKLNGFGSMLRN